MAAILRVKRRRTEDPAGALVVVNKRFKESGDQEGACAQETDTVDSVFKFAGTVNKKDTAVGQQVRDAIRKAKLQRDVLRQHASPATPTFRARQESAKSSADARYKVVAKKRALGLDELDMEKEKDEAEDVEAEGQKVFHLLDLVSDIPDSDPAPEAGAAEAISCNGVGLIREPVEQDCVYDLYYINDPHFTLQNLNSWRIEARWEQEFLDERAGDSEDEHCYERDYDTDDENNPVNDYPDEEPAYARHRQQRQRNSDDSDSDEEDEGAGEYRDPFDSDEEEYYAQMIEDKLTMGEDGSTSDDDDDGEGFVYYKGGGGGSGGGSVLSAYEKYKKQMLKELKECEEEEKEEGEEVKEKEEAEMD